MCYSSCPAVVLMSTSPMPLLSEICCWLTYIFSDPHSQQQRHQMTELGLFPRGKSAAAADAAASSTTPKSGSGKQDARKRKSPSGASPQDSSKGKGVKDKDWLFGGGGGDKQQGRPSAPGKRPRGESSASSPGGIGPSTSKGKVRL